MGQFVGKISFKKKGSPLPLYAEKKEEEEEEEEEESQ